MSRDLDKSIPADLQLKMCDAVEQPDKLFQCKECGRKFPDGRQLGGHTSRAHKKPNRRMETFQNLEERPRISPHLNKTKKIRKIEKVNNESGKPFGFFERGHDHTQIMEEDALY